MELVSHYPALNRPTDPLVSVCIANYNGEDLLPDCIESLHRQDAEFSFEIIVHDDASNDGSIELLRRDYPEAEILASNENAGFCIANNRMATHARGQYVLLLNNDAALLPDALSTLLTEAQNYPGGAILTLPQFDWESNTLVDRGSLLDPFYNPTPNLDPERRDVAMVIGACFWIDCQNWQRLGGFPEWFESIAEDLWLCSAARLRGLPVRVLRTSGFRHRQGHSFGGNKLRAGKLATTYRRRRLSERNKTFTLLVMTPALIMWPLLVLHLTLLLTEGLLLAVVRMDARIAREVYLPLFPALAKNWRKLQRERNLLQKQRAASLIEYWRVFTFVPRKLVLLFRHGWPHVDA